MKNIWCIYFSPTHGTRKAVLAVANGMAAQTGASIEQLDITLPANRDKPYAFGADDTVLVGAPVYAGRLPQSMLGTLGLLSGDGARAVAVVSYGNRDYDDALLELADMLTDRGFKVVAGCAFIAEHSYTARVGAGRPDEQDMRIAEEYGSSIAAKKDAAAAHINGNRPYMPYRMGVEFGPDTNDDCTQCMLCARQCPVAAISLQDARQVDAGLCIHCHACVKFCPESAKTFGVKAESTIAMLEGKFMQPRQPELML